MPVPRITAICVRRAGDAEIVVVDQRQRAVAQQRHALGLADDLAVIGGVEAQRLFHRHDRQSPPARSARASAASPGRPSAAGDVGRAGEFDLIELGGLLGALVARSAGRGRSPSVR